MYSLSPEVKTQWAISTFQRTVFYTLFFGALEWFVISDYVNDWPLPNYWFTIIIFLIGIFTIFIYPGLAYKFWKFEVRPEELYIERGVLTRINTTTPYSRVQHLDIEQSLTDRWLGLGKLVVYTAGTKGADLVIPGLPIDYANDLRDKLKNYTNEDAV
jgi:hypothetical protein